MPKNEPKNWIPPDNLSLSERDFLVDRAETINGIIAQSYLKTGQVLLQVKRKFKADPELNGWFSRWVNECLPFSYAKSASMCLLAERAENDPELLALTDSHSCDKLYRLTCLPGESRQILQRMLTEGEEFSGSDLQEYIKEPEIILEKAQEYAEEVQMKLLQLELAIPSLSGAKQFEARQDKQQEKRRLKKALQKLMEAKNKVEELETNRSANEILLDVMRRKVLSKDLILENLLNDPVQKRKRGLAKTVVDATKGLDLLLSSLDRYETDKSELSSDAIRIIERKMSQVQNRLADYYASKT